LVVCSILLISATTQKTKGNIVYINAYALQGNTSEIEVSKHDTVIIRKGWGACTRGLLLDYQDALTFQHYVLSKDGENVLTIYDVDGQWGEPYSTTDDYINLCYWDVPQGWINFWTYDKLGNKLSKVGDYELMIEFATTVTVSDGYDGDQDGEIDVYEPYSMDGHTVTIHVTD